MSEIIEYFFDAYFHQDWRMDHSSSLEAVEMFNNDEPTESKIKLKLGLQELLLDDELSQDTIQKLGGSFRPESEGMTVEEWINKVLVIIKN